MSQSRYPGSISAATNTPETKAGETKASKIKAGTPLRSAIFDSARNEINETNWQPAWDYEVNGRDCIGVPYVHRAYEISGARLVKLLLQKGADVNALWEDKSLLRLVVAKGDKEFMIYLLDTCHASMQPPAATPSNTKDPTCLSERAVEVCYAKLSGQVPHTTEIKEDRAGQLACLEILLKRNLLATDATPERFASFTVALFAEKLTQDSQQNSQIEKRILQLNTETTKRILTLFIKHNLDPQIIDLIAKKIITYKHMGSIIAHLAKEIDAYNEKRPTIQAILSSNHFPPRVSNIVREPGSISAATNTHETKAGETSEQAVEVCYAELSGQITHTTEIKEDRAGQFAFLEILLKRNLLATDTTPAQFASFTVALFSKKLLRNYEQDFQIEERIFQLNTETTKKILTLFIKHNLNPQIINLIAQKITTYKHMDSIIAHLAKEIDAHNEKCAAMRTVVLSSNYFPLGVSKIVCGYAAREPYDPLKENFFTRIRRHALG